MRDSSDEFGLIFLSVIGLAVAFAMPAWGQPQGSTYAPPRSVADIIGMTARLQVDEAEPGRTRTLATAQPPAEASRRELVNFYVARANAAGTLGDTARHVADYRRALELADPKESYGARNEINRRWILSALALAEFHSGVSAEGVRLQQQLLAEANNPGWRLSALRQIAYYQGEAGSLADLEKTISQAEAVFAAASGDKLWNNWQQDWICNYEMMRGWYHHVNGRYDEAELSALRAVRAAEAFVEVARANRARGIPMGTVDFELGALETARIDLAFFQTTLGKLNEAEYVTRRELAERFARNPNATASLRTPLQRLGDIMLVRGRYADAEAMYREALRVLDAAGVLRGSSRSLITQRALARTLGAQGRWQDSLAIFRALQESVKGDAMKSYAHVDSSMAYAYLRTGQPGPALSATQSLANWYYRSRMADTPFGILARGIHAIALSASGNLRAADREFDDVIPRLSGRGAPSLLSMDAAPFTELRKRWIIEGYLEHLVRKFESQRMPQDAVEEGLIVSDAVRGRGVQKAIQQASVRAASGTPALAELARREQDLRNEIGALYAVLNTRLMASRGTSDALERQMRSRIERATLELDKLVERMRSEFRDYADLVAPRLPAVADLRAALRVDEALLVLHLAGENSYVWALRRDGEIGFSVSRVAGAIEADVARLRQALDPRGAGIRDRIPEYDTDAAHRLYLALVRPIEHRLQGVRHLAVVTNGVLQQVPLAVLLASGGPVVPDAGLPFAEYRDLPWLARRYAFSSFPSVGAFLSLRRTPTASSPRLAFAGFGDPVFSASARVAAEPAALIEVRGGTVALRSGFHASALDSADLAQLPRLPDTSDEVIAVANAVGAQHDRDVFLGVRASERQVKSGQLADRRVILFATHGLVPGDLNGLNQPALALSAPAITGDDDDGLLTMEEVLGLKLNADWVVLSACNTASGDGAGGEAFSGLGRAFFYAGARALLVSGWPVETVSARRLTASIFERQANDPMITRSEALRQSSLELLDTGVARSEGGAQIRYSYAHPLFWAPFFLVGDGGR